MIDEKAFNAAASVYRRKIKYRGWAPDMALYAAIDAYLAAAPLSGAEPVVWDKRHPKIRALSNGGQRND